MTLGSTSRETSLDLILFGYPGFSLQVFGQFLDWGDIWSLVGFRGSGWLCRIDDFVFVPHIV